MLKVCEIFDSIQGEGRYAGFPVRFLRLSGCNRKCDFCDTKFHLEGKDYSTEKCIELLKGAGTIVVTGGEPLLQKVGLNELMLELGENIWHLETNGDLLCDGEDKIEYIRHFSYVSISPKSLEVAQICRRKLRIELFIGYCDIKVVTDLVINKDMIKYATMLMPLTTYTDKDNEVRKKVWNYCIKNSIRYSPRLQVEVWKDIRKK